MTTARNIRILIITACAAIAVRLLNVLWLHPLNWDEIEFFRATDFVARGFVPFRGFFEHHTPLQWFLFAPVAAMTRSVDGWAIVTMRVAQIPLWIAAFALMSIWTRDAGVGRFARRAAIAIAVSSSFLMLAAVEYRVDVLGCALYAAALVMLQRLMPRPSPGAARHPLPAGEGSSAAAILLPPGEGARRADEGRAIAAGAFLAFAGLANLRLGPLLALTAIVAVVIAPRTIAWLSAGVASVLALFGAYTLATHSLRDAIQHLWFDNLLADRYGAMVPHAFFHRLLISFGVSIDAPAGDRFNPATVDLGGIALLILGTLGLVLALRRPQLRDPRFILAVLSIANLAFIAKMNFIYNYHFEIVVVMMLPLIATAIEWLGRERAIVATIIVCAIASSCAAFFRGKGEDRAYQDFLMREVDRRTAPGDRVFDGIGWALRREPAYRYWFVPDLVRQLEPRKLIEPYDVAQVMQEPPAAFIADLNILFYMREHPRLLAFLRRHYVPRWHELWMPAPNARLTPSAPSAEWIVPANGRYRIYASPRLAQHPWFIDGAQAEVALPPVSLIQGATLQWSVDGVPRDASSGVLLLRKKERLRVVATTSQPLGLFLVPGDDVRLFRQPPRGVSLDSLALRTTHMPSFRRFAPD
ncbi:MAG: hypothetical protein JWO97_2012 [Acidobacteria bacterium]|nr:hypothetical protein [Acidobacteriota bacterium]